MYKDWKHYIGIGVEQYGSFLIPVKMAKLPLDVRLQTVQIIKRDVWEIDELLHIIKGEVQARKISDAVKVNGRKITDIT